MRRLREIVALQAPDTSSATTPFAKHIVTEPTRPATDILNICSDSQRTEYDIRHVLECLVDHDSWAEYKPEYGQTLVTGVARIGGYSVGIVANQNNVAKQPMVIWNLAV